VYAIEERPDGVYVQTPPVTPWKVIKHEPHRCSPPKRKPAGAPPRVLGITTTAMDAANPRLSTSDALLEHAMRHAKDTLHADTQTIRLRDLAFRHCEGNYSKASHACTWPCAITERDHDQLTVGTRARTGRRRPDLHADPLGQRFVVVLQDGRAPELRAEPGTSTIGS
jgi:hypothetical protein